MSDYRPFPEIAAAVAELIRATGKFKRVIYCQATNAEQLWQSLEALAALPAAVVMIGQVPHDRHGLRRTVRVMVCIAAPFARGAEAEAAGVWNLADVAAGVFYPRASAEGMFFPEAAGIEFEVESLDPIPSPGPIAACVLTLAGMEFLSDEEEEA
jgi:hypothetical protein